ncbi:acyltransferase family protein [Cohnella nanjingensis]|uniref:Acyltransferase n=1 Tax=Cohnella nanjingensis TaxID=1387779 RepID=A0A7X0RN83_9BACL|nr:acyltransferase [Cohnella nanjingensis]MBB6670632.1 acyltransferase [Cohnella nanjingensis]
MKQRNLEIDRLRAFAIIMTVLVHIPGPFAIPKGILNTFHLPIGVDLFFAISGYLMTTILLRDMESNKSFGTMIKKFYIRRATRILPQAWFWLTVILIGSFTWTQVFSNSDIVIPQYFAAMGFIQNFAVGETPYHPLLHVFWSLSLEEQFYLIFPIILFFLRKKGVVIFGIAYLELMIIIQPAPNGFWPYRLDGMLCGALLAILYNSKWKERIEPKFLLNRPMLASIVSIISIVALLIIPGEIWMTSLFFPSQGIFAAIVLYFAIFNKGYSFPTPWGVKQILDWIGTRSYVLYLNHSVAYFIVWRLMPHIPFSNKYTTFVFLVASFFAMCLSAELTYRLIETPLRKLGRRIPIKETKGHLVAPNTTLQ